MKNIFRLILSALAVVTGASGLSAQMTPAHVEVTQVKGEIEAVDLYGSSGGGLFAGSRLAVGTEIRTGKKSLVKVAFANGIRLTVEEGTTMRIAKTNLSRTGSTRESGFMRISTNKEPSFSATEISVVSGSVLLEIPPLNLPVSSFIIDTNYHRSVIQEPKNPDHKRLFGKPVVMRFEQGIDYGRLSIYKGVAHSVPNYKELGPASDITEGNSVTYRFKKNPAYEPVRNAESVNDAISDPPETSRRTDPDNPNAKPRDPLFTTWPDGPYDETLYWGDEHVAPPPKPRTWAGLP